MPTIATRQVQYQSEVTGTSSPITVKVRADYADLWPEYNPAPTTRQCSGGRLFKPRRLIGEFADGSSINFIVGARTDVRTLLGVLMNDLNAICAHYIGEEWARIPGTGNPAVPAYAIPLGFADKLSGSITYESDVVGGDTTARVSIERQPAGLAAIAQSCAETRTPIDEEGICSASLQGFVTRGYVLTAQNIEGGSIVRKAPVAAAGSIIDCRSDAGSVAVCVGYKGERVRNAHLYL